ncbi:bifunctional riboflavin kinase/FAD synthetase [Aureitalea marina]|uniref:Riboflavin biosynthesis protein n=1 Tax=Aureitalea marina TaxID=930804 RepID=A0A2S7KRJ1_9FLAO|nr:bifunctional riboflavin kinase/FAD synthetase [Aureitalea marina]PQB05245.1 riboflavin biosynthesis protein RibF [Aureitalea marina]
MKQYSSAKEYKNDTGCVLTIGTFDGVHIGHQTILKRVIDTAREAGLDSALLTFFPHPRMVLQKESDIRLLSTLEEKKKQLQALGLDHLIIQPFTKEFSRLDAEEYVTDILVGQLNAAKIIIGYDHRFGKQRGADIEDLKRYGDQLGFEVIEIDAQEIEDVAVSSTKVRNALLAGDMETANNYLGYNYPIRGEVVRGKGLGGPQLNYPTANLHVAESYKLIPAKGVYIVKSRLKGKTVYGITNIGTNPTVGGQDLSIETHFLDIEADLYGSELKLAFLHYIRQEETFADLGQLKAAIRADEEYARKYLSTHG